MLFYADIVKVLIAQPLRLEGMLLYNRYILTLVLCTKIMIFIVSQNNCHIFCTDILTLNIDIDVSIINAYAKHLRVKFVTNPVVYIQCKGSIQVIPSKNVSLPLHFQTCAEQC